MSVSLATLKIEPPIHPERSAHNGRLDSLRGFAACSVMVVHSFGNDGVEYASPISASNEYVRHLHMSRAAVLLFFITSGYVIGLTNQTSFTAERAGTYLKKRALRLIPLYLIAIVLGWIAYPKVTAGNVFANALFLQNGAWGINSLSGNYPVWSLHYEVIFYLGFLALWAYRPRVLSLSAAMLTFAIFDWFYGGSFSFLGGWSSGGFFWLAGLLLAWGRPALGNKTPLLSILLLTYATTHLWPGIILLNGLGFPYAGRANVWLSDLLLLPCTLVVFCAATQINFRGLVIARWLAALIPAGTCALLLSMGRLWENVPWTMSGVATAIAIPLSFVERESWSAPGYILFQPVGKISYGLYLLHAPLVIFVVRIYPWNGGILNYAGGFFAWLTLTLALAWLCESKLQPLVVSVFRTVPSIPKKLAETTVKS